MNPTPSANYLSHGISCRLGNAENHVILSVFVSQAVSYALTQSHLREGISRHWCIGVVAPSTNLTLRCDDLSYCYG